MQGLQRPDGAPRRRGFTFAELLLTMTMVGIVAAVLMPRVRAISGANSVQRATIVITADIQRAYSLAARQRKTMRLTITTATPAKYTITTRPTATTPTTTTFVKRYLQSTQAEYPLNAVAASRTQLDIFPDGFANDTLLLTLQMSGYTKKLWFSRTGQMRIRP